MVRFLACLCQNNDHILYFAAVTFPCVDDAGSFELVWMQHDASHIAHSVISLHTRLTTHGVRLLTVARMPSERLERHDLVAKHAEKTRKPDKHQPARLHL